MHGKNNIKKQKETEKKGIDDLVAAGRKKRKNTLFLAKITFESIRFHLRNTVSYLNNTGFV